MGLAILHILPIAVAAAISSVPIMATIVLLLSPARSRSAMPFLVGWVLGLAAVVTLCTILAQGIPTPRSTRRPDTVIGVAEIVIGLALLVVAVVAWVRSRRNPSDAMPKWLNRIDALGPWSAFSIALLLNVRPKALLLAVAAGLAVRAENLSIGLSAIVILIYTVISASTVAIPIIMTLAAPHRMEPRLRAAQAWLARNASAVTSAILALIAVLIVISGFARF
ncbi:GAP family protein [Humibacter soli]